MALETPTVPAAAAALGVTPGQIIKSMLFMIKEQPVLVIASGDTHRGPGPLAARFGVGKKQVKLADTETVLRLMGYPAGGVPPFGRPAPLPALLDRAVALGRRVRRRRGRSHAAARCAGRLRGVTGAEWIEL